MVQGQISHERYFVKAFGNFSQEEDSVFSSQQAASNKDSWDRIESSISSANLNCKKKT